MIDDEYKWYNVSNLSLNFRNFLLAGNNLSKSTVKNYLSDLRHFLGWLSQEKHEANLKEQLITLRDSDLRNYCGYLVNDNVPNITINRRLSTLRRFFSYLVLNNWRNDNPASLIANQVNEKVFPPDSEIKKEAKLMNESVPDKRDLSSQESLKSITHINNHKNFQFNKIALAIIGIGIVFIILGIYKLVFYKSGSIYGASTSLIRPSRTLSYQGVLKDSSGLPISVATKINFSLYNQPVRGKKLYYSGFCLVKPNFDGSFGVNLGSGCGSEIDSSVFANYSAIYLGITVGTDQEMRPRQKIPTVAYALNSDNLQGFAPGTDKNSIAYLNGESDLLLGNTTPGIRATSSSASFVISSGKGLVLQSAGLGDITLSATEAGNIKFLIGGVEVSRYTNYGRFGIGTETPDVKLDVQDSSEQFRLTYGPSDYTSFQTDNNGDLTLTPTGGDNILPGRLSLGRTTSSSITLDVAGTAQLHGGSSQIGLFVSSDGQVGIGTTSPTSLLEVNGDLKTNGNTTLGDNSGDSLTINASSINLVNSSNVNLTDNSTTALNFESGLFNIDTSNGRIGIGTTAPTSKLSIVGGNCSDDAGGGGCTADLAELYPASEPVEKGDVLVIDQNSSKPFNVKKADQVFDQKIIGVVSSAPAIIIDGGNMQFLNGDYKLDPFKPAVALGGRVPVKISPDSAEIKPGDLLTSSQYPGLATKADKPGFIIGKALESWRQTDNKSKILVFVAPSWADNQATLTNKGNLKIIADNQSSKTDNGIDPSSNANDYFDNIAYYLQKLNTNGAYETIDRLGFYSDLYVGKIDSGLIKTKDIVVEGVLATNKIIAQTAKIANAQIDNLTVHNLTAEKIVSPVVKTEKLTSQSIDTSLLQAEQASISGQLRAKTVVADNIDKLQENVDQNQSALSGYQIDINEIQKQLSSIHNNVNTDTPPQLAGGIPSQATNIDTSQPLVNYGQTTLFDTNVLGNFVAGQLAIKDNQLLSLNSALFLNALDKIDLLDGAAVVARDGSLTVRGEIIAQGGIRTNSIRSATSGGNITVRLDSRHDPINDQTINSQYQFINGNGEAVANIDASGSASFQDLSLSYEATPAAILAASDSFQQSGILAPGIKTNASVTGSGTLPSGETKLVIYNNKIKDTSRVYITATTTTKNQSLYVSEKHGCLVAGTSCQGFFIVAMDEPIDTEVSFDWWIVN